MEINIKSNAKINIGLNVIKKRDDGYHELEMIMAPIDLFDNIKINFTGKKGDLIICDSRNTGIPTDKTNIIYKIYDSFYNYTNIEREEISIDIEKNIPFSAGLGGGSGNGGAFLIELNRYHNSPLNEGEMVTLSKKVGADIPFFIYNKCAVVTGIGEKIELFESNLDCAVILIKPQFGVNTKYAYECIKSIENKKYGDILAIRKGMEENNIDIVKTNIKNNIRDGLIICDENVKKFEEKLSNINETTFFMSGSGSCYYALTLGRDTEKIYNKLKENFSDCFVSINRFL